MAFTIFVYGICKPEQTDNQAASLTALINMVLKTSGPVAQLDRAAPS